MIGDAARLLLANAMFLLAGIGVLGVDGSRHARRSASRAALAYLAGVAAFGLLAQLLLVAGLALVWWQAVSVSLLVFGAGLLRGRGAARASPALRGRSPRRALLLLPAGAILALLGVQSLYQPLDSWDAWAFWVPKAESIVLLGGLDPHYFAAPTTANADYPILLPAIEATDFRFVGHFDTQILHLQFWLILIGFLAALPALLRDQVRPAVLRPAIVVLACTPGLAVHVESAYADVPLAIFFALAGVLGWRWLFLRERSALPLLATFAAAATATKVEGRFFVAALVISLAAVAARDSVGRSCRIAATGLAAAAAGILPWSIWLHVHGVHGLYHPGLAALGAHAERVVPASATLIGASLHPFEWLLVVPAGLAALLLAYRYDGDRLAAALVLSTFVLCLVALVGSYWATPYDFGWHLRTSADRVVISPVLFVAALTPLLLESVLRRSSADPASAGYAASAQSP
jgi:hypothetical protein